MPTFKAKLVSDNMGPALSVDVPERIMAHFNGRRRVPVEGTINGTPFQTTIATMDGKPFIGFRKEYRDAAKLEEGQTVTITIEAESGPRVLTIPKDLAARLAAAKLRERFDAMSYTYRKEAVQAVTEARKPETRERRILKTVEDVRERARKPVSRTSRLRA
ncbi:MAG: hypothetical protein NVSMB57_03270 [Actinomycetota bacterium]